MFLKLIIHLEVLGNLTNKPLEGKLPDQELSTLLVLTDFTIYKLNRVRYHIKEPQFTNKTPIETINKDYSPKSNSTRSVSVGLLNPSGCWSRLTGSL